MDYFVDMSMQKLMDHLVQDSKITPVQYLGGGYSVRKPMGVCHWPLKIAPKKIEGIWGQKDQIL